jgi:hypothetical protein
MDDQQAMSIAEIMSINELPGLTEEIQVSPDIPAEFAREISSPIVQTQSDSRSKSQPVQPMRNTEPGDLFGMFSLEQTDLSLNISVKLPAKTLLKMMYTNSQNKEEFLDKLAAYINNNVTVDAIKSSMRKSLDPDKKKKT